jgi:DNA end-binding protein Ku
MRDEDDRPAEESDGLSTGKKMIAGAALGVAVPAAVGVARKLISDDGDDNGDQSGSSRRTGSRSRTTGTSRTRSTGSRSTASRSGGSRPAQSKSKSTTARSTRTGSASARTTTREQLYRQATRLKIDGRSRMSKAQLERAVARAKAK